MVAAIQMASGPQVAANLESASRLIAQAADSGARLVVLPENFAIIGMTECVQHRNNRKTKYIF